MESKGTTEEAYEAPALTVLGTLADLTKGNSGTLSIDLNLAISLSI